MHIQSRLPLRPWNILPLLLLPATLSMTGCREPAPPEKPDPEVWLERLEQDRRRHDPRHFAEVDLGEFAVTVTQPDDPSIFFVRFHLYGVVPESLLERFEQLRDTHNKRLRDTVLGTTQKCRVDELDDPSLTWLKSDLLTAINRLVQAPILKDVAFADFTFERG